MEIGVYTGKVEMCVDSTTFTGIRVLCVGLGQAFWSSLISCCIPNTSE